jgi:hypothetical protein
MHFRTILKSFNNNNVFRYYSHHRSYPEDYYFTQKIIINLLGDRKCVDEASWEIKSFAQEKSLNTANIVYDNKIIKHFLCRSKFLNFIVNRCYNISCDNILYLNHDIINNNVNDRWKPYNLYVMPHATNRFTTCNFIQNCKHSDLIIYPLAASKENKRRDINILICND